MRPDVLAVFIPIFFVIGLFTAISLNAYYKYKTNAVMSERLPHDALGEWFRANAQARAIRNRGGALRWGGFMVGAGIGTAIGCIILASGGIPQNPQFDEEAIATFLVLSLAIFLGGAGMIGAYFLERKLDGKVGEK